MLKNLYINKDGNALILCIFVIFFLVAVGGLVIDMGILYKTKGEMRKAANAAALSGVQEIFNSDEVITNVVNDILKAHNEEDSLESLQIKPGGEKKLTVTLKKAVPVYFMKVFGIKNPVPLEVSSSAKVGPLGVASGTVPLGVPLNVINSLSYGQEYALKVGPGDSTYGNFGIMSLSDSWNIGRNYEYDLSYGCSGEIKIGKILDTQTGNVNGKTKNAIEYRLSKSPNIGVGLPSGKIDIKNDTRVLKVLVYEEVPHSGNQLKQIKVVGFAYFYLKGSFNDLDSTIAGYFIKGIETGSIDESAVEKGAYAIKLVE